MKPSIPPAASSSIAVTEGGLLLYRGKDSLARLSGKRAFMIGDAMREELTAIGEGFIKFGIISLVVLTRSRDAQEEFALALFAKNALHAFTVTLGVESERLPTTPAVNQVQSTRRARAEDPATEQELAEEVERMVYAVLQCAVPAPSPSESCYLARIFRGNAVTA